MTPDLSDQEIDGICNGLVQSHAKVRYLRGLGLRVDRRPNGRPLVARAEWDRWSTGQQHRAAPPAQTAHSTNGPRWLRTGVA